MRNNLIVNFFLIIFSGIFLFSCSQNNNNFDLSNLPKPKKIKLKDPIEKDINNADNQLFVKDLIAFESKEKLLSKFQFGKKNPFSKNQTQLNSNEVKRIMKLNLKYSSYKLWRKRVTGNKRKNNKKNQGAYDNS